MRKPNIFESRKFQLGLLYLMCNDQLFCDSNMHVIKINYFKFNEFKILGLIAMRHHDKYDTVISKDQIEVEITSFFNTKLAERYDDTSEKDVQKLYEEVKSFERPDPGWYRDKLVPFAKQREAHAFFKRFESELNKGDDGNINIALFDKLVENYRRLEDDGADLPKNFFNELTALKESVNRNAIPTPWESINKDSEGIGEGEVWGFLGRTNVGKTGFLTACGIHAIKQGFNVFHISMEDPDRNTRMRYAAGLTGISRNSIPPIVDTVISRIKEGLNGWGKLFHIFKEGGQVKASAIKRMVQDLEKREKVIIDLVIVDYIPQCKPEQDDRTPDYQTYEDTVRVFRSGIQALKKRGLTAFQGDRNTEKAIIANMSNLGKSYGQGAAMDGCISINQLPAEHEMEVVRLHIVKMKDSPGVGNTFIVEMDHGTCTYKETNEYKIGPNGMVQFQGEEDGKFFKPGEELKVVDYD